MKGMPIYAKKKAFDSVSYEIPKRIVHTRVHAWQQIMNLGTGHLWVIDLETDHGK